MKFYNHFLLLLLGYGVILNSCEHKLLKAGPNFEYRQIAWNELSEEEKSSVIQDWKKAIVRDELVSLEGLYVVSVTFRTSVDELLGPIVVYIDEQTREVVGRAPRD